MPANLPLPPGATLAFPADPSIGIASAIYTIPLQPDAAASWLKAAFLAAGYSANGITSAEDGSVALNFSGRGSCRVMLTIKPLGSARFLSVYYGVTCPTP